MYTVTMEASIHGLCNLHEFGDSLINDGDVDRCQCLLLVQAPNMELVNGSDTRNLYQLSILGGERECNIITHQFKVMSNVVKVDAARNTFKKNPS